MCIVIFLMEKVNRGSKKGLKEKIDLLTSTVFHPLGFELSPVLSCLCSPCISVCLDVSCCFPREFTISVAINQTRVVTEAGPSRCAVHGGPWIADCVAITPNGWLSTWKHADVKVRGRFCPRKVRTYVAPLPYANAWLSNRVRAVMIYFKHGWFLWAEFVQVLTANIMKTAGSWREKKGGRKK